MRSRRKTREVSSRISNRRYGQHDEAKLRNLRGAKRSASCLRLIGSQLVKMVQNDASTKACGGGPSSWTTDA